MTIRKIVITGGPCAGKTTALSWIQNEFSKRGYKVLFVPETATELISGGVAPWTTGTNLDYQKCQVLLQLAKEKIFEKAAATMPDDKILIVCDRGAMDNRAYMNDEEWKAVQEEIHKDEMTLRDGYDAVFHMITAASGAQEAYTLANNAARYENVNEAVELDRKLMAAWTGHQHLHIIDNSTDFEKKLERLIAEIASFLGEPDPMEVERKYLISYPDCAWLESLPNCKKDEIEQTYLKSEPGVQIRVRRRGTDGHYVYYRSEKKPVSDTKRVEVEERLVKSAYEREMQNADPEARTICKTRYSLVSDNRYFKIDVYPEWKKQAVMEVELRNEDEQIKVPEGIKIIRDVTTDTRYKNYSLARNMAEED